MFDYKAQQPDELDLHRGDVVKVYRKMGDGEEIFNLFYKLQVHLPHRESIMDVLSICI